MALPRGAELATLLDAERSGGLERMVCRLGGGRHACPPTGRLTRAEGLVGDRWSAFQPVRMRQLTIMDVRVIRVLLAHAATRPGAQLPLVPGEVPDDLDRPGDNLVVDLPTSLLHLPPGARLRIGSALVEANDLPHRGCKKFEERFGADALAWVNDPAHDALRLRGINAFVVEDGDVRVGDIVVVLPPGGA